MSHLAWVLFSLLMIVPLPIHIFPLIMLAQANNAKVRSWYITGSFFLLAEIGLLVSFVMSFGSFSTQMMLTMGGSMLSYLLGNALLIRNASPYLKRMELGSLRALNWIPSVASDRKKSLTIALDSPEFFMQRLLNIRGRLQNATIKKRVDRITQLFQLVQSKGDFEGEKFLSRHSTAVNILQQYADLEASGLHNPTTVASKKELETVLQQAIQGMEQEVTNLFRSEILDVSAESDAYIQILKNRNLLKEG